MNPQVDKYLGKLDKWRAELEQLRAILLECNLTEALKWGSPCYSSEKGNIAIIGGLKESCVLGFFKGVLLQDAHGILVQPGKNTRSARSIHFTDGRQIAEMKDVLKAYIFEAIEVEQAGMKLDFKENAELPFPQELEVKLNGMPAFKAAFEALTPGRRRAYLLHFSAPKQSKTRQARVEKWMGPILKGKGLNDS